MAEDSRKLGKNSVLPTISGLFLFLVDVNAPSVTTEGASWRTERRVTGRCDMATVTTLQFATLATTLTHSLRPDSHQRPQNPFNPTISPARLPTLQDFHSHSCTTGDLELQVEQQEQARAAIMAVQDNDDESTTTQQRQRHSCGRSSALDLVVVVAVVNQRAAVRGVPSGGASRAAEAEYMSTLRAPLSSP